MALLIPTKAGQRLYQLSVISYQLSVIASNSSLALSVIFPA
jgi:hypothetical protein